MSKMSQQQEKANLLESKSSLSSKNMDLLAQNNNNNTSKLPSGPTSTFSYLQQQTRNMQQTNVESGYQVNSNLHYHQQHQHRRIGSFEGNSPAPTGNSINNQLDKQQQQSANHQIAFRSTNPFVYGPTFTPDLQPVQNMNVKQQQHQENKLTSNSISAANRYRRLSANQLDLLHSNAGPSLFCNLSSGQNQDQYQQYGNGGPLTRQGADLLHSGAHLDTQTMNTNNTQDQLALRLRIRRHSAAAPGSYDATTIASNVNFHYPTPQLKQQQQRRPSYDDVASDNATQQQYWPNKQHNPLISNQQQAQYQQDHPSKAAPSAVGCITKEKPNVLTITGGKRNSRDESFVDDMAKLRASGDNSKNYEASQLEDKPDNNKLNPNNTNTKNSRSPSLKDDIDIVFNRLMSLEAFRKLHPSVIRNLCSYASLERIDKDVIVFRQGDDAINWYAVLEGSVDVKVAQSGYGQKDGVTLCTLGVGTTFGASVMPGKSHSVSVVTSDQCTLLRVRRADFQEIFQDQSHLIGNVEASPFCSFTSLNHNRVVLGGHSLATAANPGARRAGFWPGRTKPSDLTNNNNPLSSGANRDQLQQPAAGNQNETQRQQPNEDSDSIDLDTMDSAELSSQLMRIGWVLRVLMLEQCPRLLQNRRVYPNQNHNHTHQSEAATHTGQSRPSSGGKSASNPGSSSSSISIKQGARQLISRGSSSQLLMSSGKSASRKVANYVASSLMRVNKTPQAQPQSLADNNNNNSKNALNLQQDSHSSDLDREQNSGSLRASIRGARHQQNLGGSSNPIGSSNSTSSSSSSVLLQKCMLGREMVDWLLELGQTNTIAGRFIMSRLQAISMWQVLLEQGIVFALNPCPSSSQSHNRRRSIPDLASSSAAIQAAAQQQQQFSRFSDDLHAYYKFWFDREPTTTPNEHQMNSPMGHQSQVSNTSHSTTLLLSRPNEHEVCVALESLWWSLKVLSKLGADACFRLILSKPANERSGEEVDMVFEELQQLKALSHLTNGIKRQLAACVSGEFHSKQNTIIFNQGDAGYSWFIILRGSVNVVIVGKGVVCTLHDGDDFGKLALVNDAPRAATIVTNEPNCYFLRVDKQHFNTILRDVEANTVRLNEHGKEVLILQKVATREQQGQLSAPPQASSTSSPEISGPAQHAHASNSTPSAGPLPGTHFNNYNQLQNNNNININMNQQNTNVPTSLASSSGASTNQPAINSGSSSTAAYSNNNNTNNYQNFGQLTQTSSTNITTSNINQQASGHALKYMVMAGTAEKMLEHLLETRIDGQTQIGPLMTSKTNLMQHDQISGFIQCQGDNFLEDFILTHRIFMSTAHLCSELLKQYQSPMGQTHHNQHQQNKTRQPFGDNQAIHQKMEQDAAKFISLQPELSAISRLLELHLEEQLDCAHKGTQRWVEDSHGNILPIRRFVGYWEQAASESFLSSLHQRRFELKPASFQKDDELVFRIYCTDHSHATIKARLDERACEIKQMAARKLNLQDKELILVHVKSNGERIIYNDQESNLSTGLSVNGRIFVCPLDHIDAISPLPEQDPYQEVYSTISPSSIANNNNNNNSNSPCQANNSTADGSMSNCSSDQTGGAQMPNPNPTTTTHSQANNINNNNSISINNNPTNTANNSINYNNNNSTTTTTNTNYNQPPHQQQNFQLASNQQNNTTTHNQLVINTTETEQQQQQNIVSHLLNQTPCNLTDIKTQMGLSGSKLEEFSSRDIAYCLTQFAWSLLKNMHEYELIYAVFGYKQQYPPTINPQPPHHSSDAPAASGKLVNGSLGGGGLGGISAINAASACSSSNYNSQTSNNTGRDNTDNPLVTTTQQQNNYSKPITANLNVFLRHFNELQYWVVTQICLSNSLSKRAQILRKFIKIAAHCKELQNLNAFFAIIMGLSNMAVARLTQTWERLPSKLKRTFSQFESLIDPSRNHRRYRLFISKMEPPIIPFMPLFLKDMTFAHEGNKTYIDNGLINFEKMQMVAQTLRTIRYCKSRPMKLDSSVCKFKGSIRSIELFFRDLKIIDNQRTLTQMSTQLEHRKT